MLILFITMNDFGLPMSAWWFVEKYSDKLDWKYVSRNPGMTPEFFEKHLDKLDWEMVARNIGMTPEFFEKHLDKLNWG